MGRQDTMFHIASTVMPSPFHVVNSISAAYLPSFSSQMRRSSQVAEAESAPHDSSISLPTAAGNNIEEGANETHGARPPASTDASSTPCRVVAPTSSHQRVLWL
jgi:hypothetical protein